MSTIEIQLVVLVKAGITEKVEPFTDPIKASARKQEILDSEDYSDSEDSVEVFTVNIDAHPTITKAKREGIKRGIWLYAWTKDGVRVVGTTGITLNDALAEIDKMSDDEINTWF
jgi:hypothetical protein